MIALADVSVDALPPPDGAFAITSPELVPMAPPGTRVRLRPADAPEHRFADGDAAPSCRPFSAAGI
ncbi:hypothetical protein [Algiphilus aromaticivorans]|uniref:hypothetical protein n=1 Tax=Algiphilus aromaticivorans TaxID=382454 RepID=UPI0005C13F08|nr:hypothetical protein [Algiphilus aromaticivorans]